MTVIKRRDFIKGVAVGGGSFAALGGLAAISSCNKNKKATKTPRLDTPTADQEVAMQHELPKLPYAYNALEPVIDEQTVKIHHDKHHAGYVKKLNAAEEALKKARAARDFALIKHWERELAFHGSGHILHTIYWESLSPKKCEEPKGVLGQAIAAEWGDFASFKAELAAASKAVEGSGWGIVAKNPIFDKLVILQAEKHQDLTQWGALPILAIDVWEHAYYLKYQNNRGTYVDNIFEIINWDLIEKRYAEG